jgi:hypothetical protein
VLTCGVGVCKTEAEYACRNFDPKKMLNKKVKVLFRCVLHKCDKCQKIKPKDLKDR